MKAHLPEPMGHSKGIKRGKFLAMSAYIKNRKISNKWLNAVSQTPRKTRMS
jgi:hypothetical protein